MHTIISQIITLLHVSTLSCHPQTACNQYLAKLQQAFQMQLLVIQFTINPLKAKRICVILYPGQQMHTIISQIITLLHVSTLSCHPQIVCNQYLAKLEQVFQMQLLVIQFTINPLKTKRSCIIQGVPLAAEPGISLIILTPMKILQGNLKRSTFVVLTFRTQ